MDVMYVEPSEPSHSLYIPNKFNVDCKTIFSELEFYET